MNFAINNTVTFTSRSHNTFRDNENFNVEKDNVSLGYSTYDGYDNTNSDFFYEIDDNSKSFDDKVRNADYADYGLSYYTQPASYFSTTDSKYEKLVDNSFLKTKDGGERFSGNLFNHLKDKAGYFSNRDIKDVAGASKLRRSDSSEYVDYNLLNAGFNVKDKYPDMSSEKFVAYLDSFKYKDEKGNEYCDQTRAINISSADKRTIDIDME